MNTFGKKEAKGKMTDEEKESFELLYCQLEAFRPLATGEVTGLIDTVCKRAGEDEGGASHRPPAAPLADLCVALVDEICALRSENYELRQDLAGGRLSHRGIGVHSSPRPTKHKTKAAGRESLGERKLSSPRMTSPNLSSARTIPEEIAELKVKAGEGAVECSNSSCEDLDSGEEELGLDTARLK